MTNKTDSQPIGNVSYIGNGFIRVRCDAPPKLESPVYTHADAGEVERLRYERDCAKGLYNLVQSNYAEAKEDWQKERDTLRAEVERMIQECVEAINVGMRYQTERNTLRAQLAERDALLREVAKTPWLYDVIGKVRNYLSASAEPGDGHDH
jgi:hypothetical protein